jgi:hypothetical protein
MWRRSDSVLISEHGKAPTHRPAAAIVITTQLSGNSWSGEILSMARRICDDLRRAIATYRNIETSRELHDRHRLTSPERELASSGGSSLVVATKSTGRWPSASRGAPLAAVSANGHLRAQRQTDNGGE